jgi:hypothetical protein
MRRLARQDHAPLLLFALVVALGAAMCVRVHRGIPHPAAASAAQPAGATEPAGLATAPARAPRR